MGKLEQLGIEIGSLDEKQLLLVRALDISAIIDKK
jgi:hypothetical protein